MKLSQTEQKPRGQKNQRKKNAKRPQLSLGHQCQSLKLKSFANTQEHTKQKTKDEKDCYEIDKEKEVVIFFF